MHSCQNFDKWRVQLPYVHVWLVSLAQTFSESGKQDESFSMMWGQERSMLSSTSHSPSCSSYTVMSTFRWTTHGYEFTSSQRTPRHSMIRTDTKESSLTTSHLTRLEALFDVVPLKTSRSSRRRAPHDVELLTTSSSSRLRVPHDVELLKTSNSSRLRALHDVTPLRPRASHDLVFSRSRSIHDQGPLLPYYSGIRKASRTCATGWTGLALVQ